VKEEKAKVEAAKKVVEVVRKKEEEEEDRKAKVAEAKQRAQEWAAKKRMSNHGIALITH
jgi:hypothetical protein